MDLECSNEGFYSLQGRFEILCLSGSYLVAENGGPRNRTGGLSISVCSPDGHVIGGAIGGRLIASSPVQVIFISSPIGICYVCANICGDIPNQICLVETTTLHVFDGFKYFSNVAVLGSSMQFCVWWWHQGKGQRDQ